MARLPRSRAGKQVRDTRTLTAVATWLDSLQLAGRSTLTLKGYRTTLSQFAAATDNPAVTAITPETIRTWLRARQEAGSKPTSLLTAYAGLRAFLQWCERQELIDVSPARKVLPPKLPDVIPPGFTPDELRRLEATCDTKTHLGARDRAIMLTLLGTGLRVAELIQLRVDDLVADGQDSFIRVRGKGNQERLIAITPTVRQAIRHWLMLRGEDDDPALWIGERGTLTDDGVTHLCRRMGLRAGVAHVHPHRFRRAALNLMLDAGMGWDSVRSIAGHHSDFMLRHYVGHGEQRRANRTLMEVDPVGQLGLGKKPRGRPRKERGIT